MAIYAYAIEGTATNGQSFVVRGYVEDDFANVFNIAVKETFEAVTQGKAIYGKPGLGCSGPYRIVRVAITRKG